MLCLKLARVLLAECLAEEPRFVVMGDNADETGLIVYSRVWIEGLPRVFEGWPLEQKLIDSVRFTERQQRAYERRVDGERDDEPFRLRG
jgi:hypothetical protein